MIVIRRDRMEMGFGGKTAKHLRHSGGSEDGRFLGMKINSRVTVRLERGGASREIGPFPQLWLVDGMVLSDRDQEQPVAEFQYEEKLWRSADGTSWESLIFGEA